MDRPNTTNDTASMIVHGKINIDVTAEQLIDLKFLDYLPCYKQLAEMEKYYTPHNSSVWQILDEAPAWVHDLSVKIPQDFDHNVVSVIKLDPGQVIPLHRDRHAVLQEKHGEGDTWRYLIFLENWKNGHYFEINNQPVVNWRAGDWIKFHRSQWHLAGNSGWEPFYSVQVTVI